MTPTRSQNDILFMRGKAMSGAPIMSGTNQLPKPPISAGMTEKKIMIRPCVVMVYVVEVLRRVDRCSALEAPLTISARWLKIWMPGSCSSITHQNLTWRRRGSHRRLRR